MCDCLYCLVPDGEGSLNDCENPQSSLFVFVMLKAKLWFSHRDARGLSRQTVAGEPKHCGVVRKLDTEIVGKVGVTVMCKECVEWWADHTALRSPAVDVKSEGGVLAYSNIL